MKTKIEAKLTKIPAAELVLECSGSPSAPPVPKAGKALNQLVIDASGGLWLTSEDADGKGLPIATADALTWAGWAFGTAQDTEWRHTGSTRRFFELAARLLRDGSAIPA